MSANEIKSPRGEIFLLVSMATLIVMTMAVKVEENQRQHQHQQQNQNETGAMTNVEIFVNENEENLTLDFNSGDLAAEKEKRNHELVMTDVEGDYYGLMRVLECRGENIKSLSAIPCETMEKCEEKKSLLFEQRKCKRFSSSYCWKECSNDGSSCLRMEMSISGGSAGIVQCTSEENGLNLTTFDHHAIGYSEAALVSTLKTKKVSQLIKMKLYVSSLNEELKAKSDSTLSDKNSSSSVNLFVDEEVYLLECRVPKLLFHKEALVIRAHMKDGSTVKLDFKIMVLDLEGFLAAYLWRYRVPADIVSFSCSAQMTNSSGEWLENRLNVTSHGLPSQVTFQSSHSRNMTVKLTPGEKVYLHCELTGSLGLKKWIQNKMRGMRSYSFNEASSKSAIEFLRFVQVAGKHSICNQSDESTQSRAHFLEPYHFVFNLAPSAPKIYKPNPNPSSSSVDLIYQEDHLVDQTLLCIFSGEPEPAITWFKNGHKFLSTKSMGIRKQGNESMEHAKLVLNSTTIQPTDFENGHVNFSCVLSNYFGSDRLDFIIMRTGEFKYQADLAVTPTTTTTTKILPSGTKTISTSTAQSTKEGKEKSNLELCDGAKISEMIALLGLVFLILVIFIVRFSLSFWKNRVSHSVGSVRILTFHKLDFDLIENDKN